MDPIFFTFIKNLPPKEQSIYLLIRAYEKELDTVHDQCSLTLIRDIYEPQINSLIGNKIVHNKVIDNKGKDTDPFEDKLGKWASDFSEDEIERMLEKEES